MRDNVYMDFDEMPRDQVEKLVVEDFNTLGYKSQLRLKQLYPEVYGRLQQESEQQTKERIRQMNDYIRNGFPRSTPTEEPAYIRRLRRQRRAAENGSV